MAEGFKKRKFHRQPPAQKPATSSPSVTFRKRRQARRFSCGPIEDVGDGSFVCTIYDLLGAEDQRVQLFECSLEQAEEKMNDMVREKNEAIS